MLADPYNSSRPETFIVSYGVTSRQLNMSTPGKTAKPTSQTYSRRLSSLQPGTVYYYRVESRNRFETIITDEIFFRTLDDSNKLISLFYY
jgi:phosphodiesterase/alkaline phosphatase D-like protein